jgi:hypothetical protein
MNQKRTGKGKGKHLDDMNSHKHKTQNQNANATAAPEEPVYPGALKRNTLVMVPLRNTTQYKLAKIIDVRKS